MRAAGNVLAISLLACVFASCTNPKPLSNNTNGAPPLVALTAAELIEEHNVRAAQLDQLHAYGVLKITWMDERGEHSDQGDAELWIDQPSRTALRVDAVGEVLLWLGSNNESWWLFDMINEPSTLHVRHGSASRDSLADSANRKDENIIPLHPLVLLDLLGITPLRQLEGEAAMYDSQAKRWTLRAASPNATLNLVFSESGQLMTIEALDASGDIVAVSVLRDEASVAVRGVNPLNWPKAATHITITLADQSGSVLLALNNDMKAALEDRQAARVFDLEAIKASLKPDRVMVAE